MTGKYRTVVGLKAQLSKFSGIIFKRFKKPKKSLIKEMLYGIQASKDLVGESVKIGRGRKFPGKARTFP